MSGSTTITTATGTVTAIAVSCAPTSIASQQTSQCTVTVTGTGADSSAVTWAVVGGGSISSSGLFTAPTVPFNTLVTIVATSTQTSSESGSATVTVNPSGAVSSVNATCNPTSIQTGQLTSCTAVVNGSGSFSPEVSWTDNGGSFDPVTGVYSSAAAGTFTITASSQQDPTKNGSVTVNVVTGANNVLPIVVDAGPTGNYVNGAFATVTVCAPGSATQCQAIDHVLVDTGSIGLRMLSKGAGGELDPALVPLPLQTDTSGNVIAQCNQFVDGFTWGSVSLATIQMAGEIASTVPNATMAGVPIQLIGDPMIPTVPNSCSSAGVDESNLQALGANGVLGIGTYQQDCGPGCVSGTPPNVYYACSGGACNPTLQGLAQQITNPVWVFPADNNGTLVQLPSVPSGGTTTVSGSLIFGVGTQTNNAPGPATVFNTDANADFTTTFNNQTPNECSFIDSGSNALFFPSSGYPGLVACSGGNSSFYCPPSLLTGLHADNQSNTNSTQQGSVNFDVGNANTLFNNAANTAFSELGGPNSAPSGCNGSFDWGLTFFYGRSVFTAIEQQPVTGTSYVGPFWAY